MAERNNLTPAEAAVVAGVSVRDVHRMIDEHILPERFFDVAGARSFKTHACVFISFYVGSAERLTAEERQRSIALACEIANWSRSKKTVQDGYLTIDFAPFSKDVEERFRRLQAARKMVVSDPEIMRGTPVIEGTRVPVYQVAAAVVAGNPTERILSAYPSLTPEQVELAALYAEATPQRGRPRQSSALPTGATMISSRRKTLRQTA